MAKTAGAARPRSWLWLQGLVCGTAASLMPGPCIVVAGLLAPAIMAAIVETTAKKPVARAMFMLGASTAVGPLQHLWSGGNSIEAAVLIASDPVRLAASWIAAASGWLIAEGSTMAAHQIGKVVNSHRQDSLRKEQTLLLVEWNSTEAARFTR